VEELRAPPRGREFPLRRSEFLRDSADDVSLCRLKQFFPVHKILILSIVLMQTCSLALIMTNFMGNVKPSAAKKRNFIRMPQPEERKS